MHCQQVLSSSKARLFLILMIGLLGLGIPTVFINAEQAAMLEEDMPLVVDGRGGLISF